MASELSKIGFPKVDKLCDAKFIKTIFTTSKKEFAQFVEQTPEMKEYLQGVEDRIDEKHTELREMIRLYLERVKIKEKASLFLADLKEKEREHKKMLKKNEMESKKEEREKLEAELREKIMQEMADAKAVAELEEKAGVAPKTKFSFKKPVSDQPGNKVDQTQDDADSSADDQKASKVVFKKATDDQEKSKEEKAKEEKPNRSMDLATLSAFISKSLKTSHLIVVDQNEQLLSAGECSVIKNQIVMTVNVDFDMILQNLIQDGKLKLTNSKGKSVAIKEMTSGKSGKIELMVD